MNPTTGQFSAIDLFLLSISLTQRVLWSVIPEMDCNELKTKVLYMNT